MVVCAVVGEDGVHKLHDVEHIVDEGDGLLLLPTAHHLGHGHGLYHRLTYSTEKHSSKLLLSYCAEIFTYAHTIFSRSRNKSGGSGEENFRQKHGDAGIHKKMHEAQFYVNV